MTVAECTNIVATVFDDRGCSVLPERVFELWGMVQTFLSLPYQFYCLTNCAELLADTNLPCLPLRETWPHPWSMLEVFAPDTFEKECGVLYFDAGITIVGELDSVVRFGGTNRLCLVRTGQRRTIYRYGTEMLYFKPEALKYGYGMFADDSVFFMQHYGRPSEYLGLVYPDTRTWPIKWTVENDLSKILIE